MDITTEDRDWHPQWRNMDRYPGLMACGMRTGDSSVQHGISGMCGGWAYSSPSHQHCAWWRLLHPRAVLCYQWLLISLLLDGWMKCFLIRGMGRRARRGVDSPLQRRRSLRLQCPYSTAASLTPFLSSSTPDLCSSPPLQPATFTLTLLIPPPATASSYHPDGYLHRSATFITNPTSTPPSERSDYFFLSVYQSIEISPSLLLII